MGTGEQLDEDVFRRFAARLSYVAGRLRRRRDVRRASRTRSRARACPVFYLEIPPFLFGRVVQGLAEAGLTKTARVVVEKPFGHDRASAARSPTSCTSTSTSRSSTGSTTTSGRWASRRSSTCGSRTRCSSRSGAATTSRRVQITMAEDFGVEDRGHFYDPVGALRDVVVNHLMQVVAAVRDGGARAGRPADDQGRAGRALPRGQGGRPGALRPRPVRRLPRRSTASRPTRRPRPTRRCASTSRTGAGRACRSSSAPASACR